MTNEAREMVSENETIGKKAASLAKDLGRVLHLWQLHRHALKDIQGSETLKLYAQAAKVQKNKDFVDVRLVSGELIRALDAYMLKMKKSMKPEVWNEVMRVLSHDQVKELSVLLEVTSDLNVETVEALNEEIRKGKKSIQNKTKKQ
jgi:hypothetical protein